MTGRKADNSLKILMIACVPYFSARGTPISIRSRLESMSHLGHRVDLVTYHVGEDVDMAGINICRSVNIPFIKAVPVGPSLIKIFLNVLVFFKAISLLMTRKYDLVHTHEEASFFGVILSKIFRIRHLYDFHSSIPQVMKNLGYDRFTSLNTTLELLERVIINSSHSLIAISSGLYQHIRKINKSVPVVIIENFQTYDFYNIDQQKLDDFKLSHPELCEKDIILYSGTFERYQGLDILMEAAAIVLRPSSSRILILAGGRREQIDKMRKTAQKLGIENKVWFTGNIPVGELSLFMKTANVLVSTRTMGNNPPLKIYDYLSSGKPMVVSDIDAHTQILNKDIAVLVDLSPRAVADGILKVLDDSEYAKNLGESARKYYWENFKPEDKINRTKEILDIVMQVSL